MKFCRSFARILFYLSSITFCFVSNPSIAQSERIEAEDYDAGGQGVGYSDLSPGNRGGQYRSDDVDIQTTRDVGGGFNVGWIDNSEWLAYTVDIATAGIYDVVLRYASNNATTSKRVVLDVGGIEIAESPLLNTGGWQNWSDVALRGVTLSAGTQRLQFNFYGRGLNFNWFELELREQTVLENQPPVVRIGPNIGFLASRSETK